MKVLLKSEHPQNVREVNKTKSYGLSFNCDNEYTVVLYII